MAMRSCFMLSRWRRVTVSFWPAAMGAPVAEVEASFAPSSVSKSTVMPKGVPILVDAAVAAADGGGFGVGDLHQRLQRLVDVLRALATSSGLFFSSGKMPALIGAMRGAKRSTTRVSSLPLSSSFTVSSA